MWASGGSRGPLLRSCGRHLMVPSWSLALSSMCGTTLVAIGCHRLVRSTEATFLHVLHLPDTQRVPSSSLSGTTRYVLKLMAHVEICCRVLLAMLWPRAPLLICLPRGPFYVCFHHEPHLASRSCRSSCVLEMVHLSWQAVCEDPCHRVVADQSSDCPVVITGPHVLVWRHSNGCWPASLFEVHGGHVSVCAPYSPCITAVVPSVTS